MEIFNKLLYIYDFIRPVLDIAVLTFLLYKAYDFKDQEYLETINKKDITILDNKIFVLLDDRIAIFTSLNEGALKVVNVPVDTNSISYKNNDGKYEVYINDKLFQTIELGNNI